MTPAAQFRPAGPRFRLLFGETAPGEPEIPHRRSRGTSSFPRRRSRGTSSGGASSTRSTRARASSGGVSGRRSITSAPCATTRSRLPASARGCPRCKRAATTTFQQRPWLDSRLPTSARSNLGCSGQPSPPPFSRSCMRARRRVYRTRIPSRSASLSSADEPQLPLTSPPATRAAFPSFTNDCTRLVETALTGGGGALVERPPGAEPPAYRRYWLRCRRRRVSGLVGREP